MPRKLVKSKKSRRQIEIESAIFSSNSTWKGYLEPSENEQDAGHFRGTLADDANPAPASDGTEDADMSREYYDSEQESSDSDSDDEEKAVEQSKKRKAAWIDEDDLNTNVAEALITSSHSTLRKHATAVTSLGGINFQEFLQTKFTAAMGAAPTWAKLDSNKNKVDQDPDAIKTTLSLLPSTSSGLLLPNTLQHRWLLHLNAQDEMGRFKQFSSSENCLRTVFAEKYPLALVTKRQVHRTGNGYLSLFQVGAEECFRLEKLFFERFPINASAFLPEDKKFIIGASQSKHFFVYDMESSKEMKIPWRTNINPRGMESMAVVSPTTVVIQEKSELTIVDTRTWRPAGTMRSPSSIGAFCAAPDGLTLYSHGIKDGKVFVWDIRSRLPRYKFVDDGCINGTAIAISPDCQYLACGSSTGIVNCYRTRALEGAAAPTPHKIFKQLLTSINSLQFNSSSEALVFSSKGLGDAIRIAHLPSMNVYSNFPGTHKFGVVTSCTFSPNSGYLAISTDAAKVHRARLEHFGKC